MAKPLIDLNDDTLFSKSSSGGGARGISVPLQSQPNKINLNDDSLFYKNKEAASQDVQAERYRAMFGYDKVEEAPKPKGILDSIDSAITNTFGTNKADPNEIDRAGVERVKQEEAAKQRDVAARRAEMGITDDRNYAARTFDAAAAGAAGFVGSTAEYLGRQFGIKTLEDVGQKAQIDAAALTPKEQDLLQKVVGGVGSFLPMATGAVLAGGATMVAGGSAALAGTVGSLVGAALEAPSIGQEAYEGARKETGNEAVAERQGYKAVAYNLPLSFITNKLGFFADKGGRIMQTGKTVLMEGAQEGGQKVLTNVMGYQETGKGVSEEALVGGLTGGVVKQFNYTPEVETAKGKDDTGGKGDTKVYDAGDQRPAAPGATQDVQADKPLLNFYEVRDTFATKPSVAAVMYLDAPDQQTKDLINKAVDRAEIREQFNEALGDQAILTDTRAEMGQFVDFVDDLYASLPSFVNDMPPAGIIKVGRPPVPTMEDVDKSFDEAWNDVSYQASLQQEADRAAAEREAKKSSVVTKAGVAEKPVVDLDSPSLFEQAKSEAKDAAAEALDVLLEVSGGKLNITGQQYTVADLPKAIQKVMEALVKMGYYKLQDISVELMKRMRGNDNWKALADSVTPEMLTDAYSQMQFDQKEAPSVTSEQLKQIIAPAATEQTAPAAKVEPEKVEPAKPVTDEAKAIEQVLSLLRNNKVGQAAKLFKEADLYAKGFGSFPELQKMAKEQGTPQREVTTPDGKKAFERKRYGDFVNKDGKVVRSAAAAQVAKTDNADEDMDQVGMTFERTNKGKVKKTKIIEGQQEQDQALKEAGETRKSFTERKKAEGDALRTSSQREPLTAPAELGLPDQFEDGQRLPAQEVAKDDKRERELDAPNQFEAPRGSQLSLGIGRFTRSDDTPAQSKLRGKLDAIVKNFSNIKFFSDTILGLQQQIADIDSQLKGIDTLVVKEDGEEKVFRARREDDENPGLWGISDETNYSRFLDGFVPDKPTTKTALLDARRRLSDELTKVRENSIRSKAALYKRSIWRMADQMMNITQASIRGGMNPEEARKVFREFYQAVSFRETLPQQEQTQEEVGFDQDAQSDFFDGARVAMGLIADYRNKMMNLRDLSDNIERGLREGDFRYTDVTDAFRAFKMSPPLGILNVATQLSVRTKLAKHLADNGNSNAARTEWLVNMDKVLKMDPTSRSRFTQDELTLHGRFFAKRDLLASRRAVDEDMRTSDNAADAFPVLLFNNYTLAQAQNDTDLKRLLGDPGEAWLQDAAYAMRRRPDLAPEIRSNMSETDRMSFDNWVARKKAAIAQAAEVMGKAPAFVELRNMASLEPLLDSTPRQGGENIRDMTVPIGTFPSEYEQAYVKIARAELSEIPAIMDTLARMNAILVGNVDPDTGEILTPDRADEMAAEYIDSLEANAVMEFSVDSNGNERSQFGKRYQENPSAKTVEEAGARDAGKPAVQLGDEASEELLQNEQIDGFDNMFEAMNETEEETDTEATEASPDVASEQRESAARGVKIPGSLTGQDFMFRRGPFVGSLIPAMVQEQVSKITAQWPGAPRIIVLPNADHLPAELRERVKARLGKNMGAKGMYYQGEVYLFSDHLASVGDVEFTLFHETYGHLGLRAFLGTKFDTFLEQTYNTNPAVKEQVDALMQAEPIGMLEAVDEVLSDMAAQNKPISAVKAYIGRIIFGLRSVGFNRVAGWMSTKTDAELGYVLKMARKSAKEGVPAAMNGAPDEFRLAEARLPYELFSSRGGKTRAYARYNPVTMTWAVFTATGTELRSSWNTSVERDFEKVMEMMRKEGRIERRLRSGLYIDNKIPSDLQQIPEFREVMGDLSVMSKDGIKTLGRMIKRNATILFQNEYKAVFDVVDYLRSKGRLAANFDLKELLEGNHERRTGAELDDLRKRFEKPLMDLVKSLGEQGGNVTIADAGLNLPPDVIARLGKLSVMDAYAIAMHAAERNKHIAKINPKKPDGGSGMLTKDATALLDELQGKPYMATLGEMSRILRQMSDYKLARMRDSGMISHAEFMARSNYQNYINLSGFNEGLDKFDDPGIMAGGPKFGTRKDKRALGRDTMATDVVARTILSFEAAVINANKNAVKQKVLSMFELNYDPDFVTIQKQAYKPVLDENGQVTEQIDPDYIRNKNVMIVHVNGRPITMEFKQTGFGTFADAIHGSVYAPEASAWPLQMMGKVNQVMGQMLTTWNPVWSVINYTRDVQNLYFNAVADQRVTKDMARQMLKYQRQARKAAFHLATDGKYGNDADQTMIDYYNEMRAEGGATSFLNFRGLEEKVAELKDLLDPKDPNAFRKTIDKVLEVVENFNIPLEMAPRIAAYRVMRENGFSRSEAAAFAGEITVNFNMRGSAKWARQMFLFFNPAVQGTNKMVKLMADNPKSVAKIAGGMFVVGFMANILARALGGDDEDGVNKLDKIPVYKRATSIVLWPEMPLMAIPIPYGWNVFYAAGNFMADTMYAGSQSAKTTAKRIFQSAFEGFSPIGSAGLDSKSILGTAAKTLAPTATLPMVDLLLNENRFGAPIVKEESSMFSKGKRANSQMGFDSASPISAAAFKGLNKATGGDKVNGGLIDVNPGAVDYLINSYVPGLGAESYKFASWATRKALGYDTKEAAMPLVDRLTAKIPEGYDFGSFRRAETLINTKYDDYLLNKGNRQEILKEYPNLGTARAIITSAKNQINDLRQARAALDTKDDMPDAKKVELYNLSRKKEKEIVQKSVRLIMQTNPQMKQELLASE